MVNRVDEFVFAPLGGVGEIGMNLAVYGFGAAGHRKWIAVDLGVSFGGEELPGIDLVVPDTMVPLGGRFALGPFNIELVSMAHSIPESNGLIIRTKIGSVLHTGDWKIDPTPVLGPPTDEAKLRSLGNDGCLALIGDS